MNIRSLYRAGSLTAAAKKLVRYKLDLMGLLKVRWVKKGAPIRAGNYIFFMEKEKTIINWEQDFVRHRKESTIKRVLVIECHIQF